MVASNHRSKNTNPRDYNYITRGGRMNNNNSNSNNDSNNELLLLHTIWSNWTKYRRDIYKQLNVKNTEEIINLLKNGRIKLKELLSILRESHINIDKSIDILIHKHDITVVTVFDERYPKRLLNMKNITESIYPPLLLYFISKCNINMNSDNIIAVVGTRRCSNNGREIAYSIGKALGKRYIIATGLAQGIDHHVTLGTLDAGGKVIEVRPYLYPFDYVQQELLDRIINNGCIISENLTKIDGYRWIAKQLYLRNRIIASIAKAVVIVEARKDNHSGTMHQVEFAIRRGKPVFIWRPSSNSNNSEFVEAYRYYINNKAKGFSDVDELLSMLESLDHQHLYQQRIDIPY